MADYGFDTTDLEKLIASLSRAQAPTDEDRSAARSQALQVAGLSLLGTPKGQVWGRAGQAGMNALAAKNDYLAGIPKQRQAALQSATQAMSLQEQLRGLQDQQAFQQRLQGGLLTGGGAVPPSSIATPTAPPMGEAGGFSAPGVTPPQAPAQAPAAPPQDYYAKAMQQADALEAFAQSGQPGAQSAAKLARDTREQALKWRDENTGVETVMGPNGPMLIQRRKHGDPTQLPYQPKPDIKEVSTNTEKFFIDPLTNKRYGDNFQMGISPADTQRIALERQRIAQAERHFQADHELSDPTKVADMAKGIASYQLPPLQSWALSKPQGQAIMGEVMRLNPAYAAQDYATSQKALNAFATGKQGQAVNSFNVALAHLDTLQEASKALKNGDSQALNKASNFFKQQTGNPAPTNFEGVKQIVGAEIVKAITNGGGGVEDRKTAAEAVSKAGSPAQLNGIIDKYKELMVGQLHGLRQQYEQTTKRKDFHTKLSPQALKLLGEGQQQEDDIAAAMRIVTGGKP